MRPMLLALCGHRRRKVLTWFHLMLPFSPLSISQVWGSWRLIIFANVLGLFWAPYWPLCCGLFWAPRCCIGTWIGWSPCAPLGSLFGSWWKINKNRTWPLLLIGYLLCIGSTPWPGITRLLVLLLLISSLQQGNSLQRPRSTFADTLMFWLMS